MLNSFCGEYCGTEISVALNFADSVRLVPIYLISFVMTSILRLNSMEVVMLQSIRQLMMKSVQKL